MAEIVVNKKIFFIPDKGAPCDTWKVYFDKLKSSVGKDNAKIIWLMTWKENGSSSCTTNADFNQFLKRNEIDVTSAATRAVADITAITGNFLGMGKRLTKVMSIGVPVVFACILLAVVMLLLKTARKNDAVDIALLASGGIGQAALTAKQLSR